MHVLRGNQIGSEVDEGVDEKLAEDDGRKPAGGPRRQEQRREGRCREEKPQAQPFRTRELPQHPREERERIADAFGETAVQSPCRKLPSAGRSHRRVARAAAVESAQGATSARRLFPASPRAHAATRSVPRGTPSILTQLRNPSASPAGQAGNPTSSRASSARRSAATATAASGRSAMPMASVSQKSGDAQSAAARSAAAVREAPSRRAAACVAARSAAAKSAWTRRKSETEGVEGERKRQATGRPIG